MTTTIVKADTAGRRAAALAAPSAVPSTSARQEDFSAQLRSSLVKRDGKEFYQVEGTASVVNTWYEMYDFYGPYEEQVAAGAFDATLAADPDVVFLLNHRGLTMARTKVSKTLELSLNEAGDLASIAYLNPERQDVRDMVHAIDDGDVDQMSFAFRIKRGEWNPDYTTYTILEVDIDRGDVSAVNYGANPHTSISARAKQVLDGIDHLEGVPLAVAEARLLARVDAMRGVEPAAAPAPVAGRNAATLRALMELDEG